jgi:hypothetical protein
MRRSLPPRPHRLANCPIAQIARLWSQAYGQADGVIRLWARSDAPRDVLGRVILPSRFAWVPPPWGPAVQLRRVGRVWVGGLPTVRPGGGQIRRRERPPQRVRRGHERIPAELCCQWPRRSSLTQPAGKRKRMHQRPARSVGLSAASAIGERPSGEKHPVGKLRMIEAVLRERRRMDRPAGSIGRQVIGGASVSGHLLPPGTLVWIRHWVGRQDEVVCPAASPKANPSWDVRHDAEGAQYRRSLRGWEGTG